MQDNEKKPALRFKGFTDPWEQRKLGELSCSFEYGLNAAAKEYDGQNKYLRITDIDDTSRQFVTTDITSPDTNLTDADSYKLSDGDVLFARTGASVGKTYLYKKFDGLVYFAGFLIRAKIKESVNAGFIFQNTLTRGYERYIAITSQRSGQPGVNAQEYAEYQLMLPELFEQDKITKLLEALDTLITLHQRKYEKLVNIKKSMLDKMFPQNGASVPEIRFKGFTDPWEQRKFSELYEKVSRKNDLTYGKDDIISVANMYYKAESYITDENYLLTYNVFEMGDIAFEGNKSKNFAHGRFVENTIGNGIVSHVFDVFKPRMTNYDLQFWKYAINNERIMGPILLRSTKASTMMTNLVADDFLQENFLIPCYEEQKKIGEFLNQLDTLITLHQRKLEKLQNIKKSCLEKMFV